jgi:carbonic anhydrase
LLWPQGLEDLLGDGDIEAFQSPIDIPLATLPSIPTTQPLEFDFQSCQWREFNNGYAIQAVPVTVDGVDKPGGGGSFSVGDITYRVVEFHFHTPSEHTFDGRSTTMELHIVGLSPANTISVVGVPLEIHESASGLASLFAPVPAEVATAINVLRLATQINLADIVPTKVAVARYVGSRTTPPYDRGVLWNVLLTPVAISSIEATVLGRTYQADNRPVQPFCDRPIAVDTTAGQLT